MLEVDVDRGRWLRGEKGIGRLAGEDGLCILGHVLVAAGADAGKLARVSTPAGAVDRGIELDGLAPEARDLVRKTVNPARDEWWWTNSELAQRLMEINDDRRIADGYREYRLSREVEPHAIRFRFRN